MAAGIGMVHQHFMLVPTLTVWENVALGAADTPMLLRRRRARGRVARSAEQLGLGVDPDAIVGELTVGEQQRVELLRVLMRGARVMIMDEPTAVLAPAEAAALFESLARLAADGVAVVLISHKLDEVLAVADRISVLRRGALVAAFDGGEGELTAAQLTDAMVGQAVSLAVELPECASGPRRLRCAGLSVRSDRGLPAVDGLSLDVHAGEIVGLAGVAGNGQVELVEALAGLRPCRGGTVELAGDDVTSAPPAARAARGLRLVPEDRNRTGTAPSLSVRENLLLRRYRRPPCRRGPWLDLRAADSWCQARLEKLQIDTSGLAQPARLLSGGNLQKVVLARELDAAAVILALHPTRGLDAWATSEVRRMLVAARTSGAAVLLWSEDLDEVLALSDRVAVIARGRIVCELPRARADLPTVGRLMAGGAPLQGRG